MKTTKISRRCARQGLRFTAFNQTGSIWSARVLPSMMLKMYSIGWYCAPTVRRIRPMHQQRGRGQPLDCTGQAQGYFTSQASIPTTMNPMWRYTRAYRSGNMGCEPLNSVQAETQAVAIAEPCYLIEGELLTGGMMPDEIDITSIRRACKRDGQQITVRHNHSIRYHGK